MYMLHGLLSSEWKASLQNDSFSKPGKRLAKLFCSIFKVLSQFATVELNMHK